MLTADEQKTFDARGVLALRHAIGGDVAAEMREKILTFIDARGLRESLPYGITPSKVRSVVNAVSFDALWGSRCRAAVDTLLGEGRWSVPGHAGQMLMMTSPAPGESWILPHKIWHLDYRAPGSARRTPGVQLFVLLDRVDPRGGGTLAIAGSHRLVDRLRHSEGAAFSGRSADVRSWLRRNVPWVRDLCSTRPGEDRVARFMERSDEFEGVALQVVEFTGEPGDVIVMHPWIVHAPAPNCGTRPRLVVTERLHRYA